MNLYHQTNSEFVPPAQEPRAGPVRVTRDLSVLKRDVFLKTELDILERDLDILERDLDILKRDMDIHKRDLDILK